MNFGGSWGASSIFPEDKTTQELYLISSIMEEAIASRHMEGAATTREAAKDMLRKKISPKDKSQRMILNNYYCCMIKLFSARLQKGFSGRNY